MKALGLLCSNPGLRSGVGRAVRIAAPMIVVLVALAIPDPSRAANCGPGGAADHINAVINTGSPLTNTCEWRPHLDKWDATNNRWKFNCWQVGCSENMPVLAAAVAVMYEPIQGGHDMRQWFLIFLKAQLGKSVTEQSVPNALGYFKGSEMLSRIYDGWTTMAVMSVYYWSVKMQPTAPYASEISQLADDYLRATFYLWGLTTGKSDVAKQYKNDAEFAGANTKEKYPVTAAATRSGACGATSCPGTELTNTRTWLFAQVAGLVSDPWRPVQLKNLYNNLSGRWSMVHGLNGTQQQYLRDLVLQHQLPGNFNAVVNGLKMIRNMHFIIWNGNRLSFFEGSTPNTNKGAYFAMGYYFHPFRNAAGKEVHFLYPYNGKGYKKPGTLTIEAPSSRLKAVGEFTAYLYVPTSRVMKWHIRIGPSGLTYCPGTLTC